MEVLLVLLQPFLNQITWSNIKRVFIIALSISILAIAFDKLTGFYTLGKIERGVKILESLEKLEQKETLINDETLLLIQQNLKSDLKNFYSKDGFVSKQSFNSLMNWRNYIRMPSRDSVLKIVFSNFLWIFVLFYYLFFDKKEVDRRTIIIAMVFCIVIFGKLATLIPAITPWLWVDLFLIPFTIFSLIPLLILYQIDKQNK